MTSKPTRRSFVKQSAALALAINQTLSAKEHRPMEADSHYICVTCGTQFKASARPPAHCPICEDERQYVGWGGQQWTTLDEMRKKYHNDFKEEEQDVCSIHTEPRFGIGQRALLLHTSRGNVLWDCVSLLDDASIEHVKKLGGIACIAVSHPHYYSSVVEWSRAFNNAPVYLHQADAQWVMRPDPAIVHWRGDKQAILGDMTLTNTGGHFEGFQVLHWPAGAGGRGILFSGDQPQVCMDRRWVTFMYSYPNSIPLGPTAIRRIARSLEPLAFDRIYGAFPNLTVKTEAKARVQHSIERYLGAIGA
jgi:hypothetical protein